MPVPKRKHGSKYNSPNLPSHTPIIGLGCSSFSTFFNNNNNDDDSEKSSKSSQDTGNVSSSSLTNVNQSNAHEKVQKSNPIVQSWIQTIHYAIENGITLLDTAPWYGHGTSEVVIGYAMEQYAFDNQKKDESHSTTKANRTNITRNDLVINTKVGRYDSNPKDQFDFTYETTMNSVQRSIQRMKCHYIDVIQLHDPEFVPDISILMNETIPALIKCRDESKIVKAIGLTGYPLEVQYYILEEVRKHDTLLGSSSSSSNDVGGNKFVFDQCLTYCHFNLHSQALFTKSVHNYDDTVTPQMKRRISHQRESSQSQNQSLQQQLQQQLLLQQQSFAQYCKHNKIPLMAAAPLSMGLLTHNEPPEWHPSLPSLQKACKEAAMIAKKDHDDVDLPTLAILYALVNGDISCTLLGMANKKQVDVALKVVKRIVDGGDNVVYHMDDESDDGNDVDVVDGDDNLGMKLNKKAQATLKKILTNNEMNVLKILMDNVNGPFANVWSNGEYEWDGLLEAEKFWSSLSL